MTLPSLKSVKHRIRKFHLSALEEDDNIEQTTFFITPDRMKFSRLALCFSFFRYSVARLLVPNSL